MAGGGAEHKLFREKHQKAGSTWGVGKPDVPRPMTANPVSTCEPGLGATTISHPFKAGKPKI